jgi:hypothetical protein
VIQTVEASEFIEEEFIGAMERQLEKHVYSHSMTISRISQSLERDLGYDGVLTSALPFYIQFKRSTLYRGSYSGQLSHDRKAVFGAEHFFYGFELHKNPNSNLFEQHNALHALAAKFPCAYVAPLFHRNKQLSDYKTRRPTRTYPWHYHNGVIHDGAAGVIYRTRIFDMTVAINPHKHLPNVDPSHHYTYNRKMDVCFHSTPEPLEPRDRSFSSFLGGVMRSFEKSDFQTSRFDELINLVTSLYPEEARESLGRFVRLHTPSAESWQSVYEFPADIQLAIIEDLLWQDFGVRQYVAHGFAV